MSSESALLHRKSEEEDSDDDESQRSLSAATSLAITTTSNTLKVGDHVCIQIKVPQFVVNQKRKYPDENSTDLVRIVRQKLQEKMLSESELQSASTPPSITPTESPSLTTTATASRGNLSEVFKCRFSGCSTESATLEQYREHDRVHTGIKPFECRYGTACIFEATTLQMAIQHVREVHFMSLMTANAEEIDRDPAHFVEVRSRLLEREKEHLRPFLEMPSEVTEPSQHSSVFELENEMSQSVESSAEKGCIDADMSDSDQDQSSPRVPKLCLRRSARTRYKASLRAPPLLNGECSDSSDAENEPQRANSRSTRRRKPVYRTVFTCPWCPAKFIHRSVIIIHMRTHNGNRPFRCTFESCNHGGIVRANVVRHVKSIHFGIRQSKQEENRMEDNCRALKFVKVLEDVLKRENEEFDKIYLNAEASGGENNSRHGQCQRSSAPPSAGDSEHSNVESPSPSQAQPATIRYVCRFDSCPKSFGSKSAWKLHDREHTLLKPFVCQFNNFCHFEAADKDEVQLHVRQMHFPLLRNVPEMEELGIEYDLDPEKYVKARQNALDYEGKLLDAFLEAQPTQKSTNQFEMKRSTEFEHSDPESGVDNSDEDQVGAHFHRVFFICRFSSCGKQFVQLKDLKEHDRTHSNIKPYRCRFEPSCTYQSVKRSNVFQHVRRMHYNLPDTICGQKARGIVDSRDAYDHVEADEQMLEEEDRLIRAWLKRAKPQNNAIAPSSEVLSAKRDSAPNSHQSRPPSEPHPTSNGLSKDPFICPLCARQFPCLELLKLHYRRLHTGTRPYSCSYTGCAFSTNYRSSLLVHIHMIHFNRPKSLHSAKEKLEAERFVKVDQRVLDREEEELGLPSTSAMASRPAALHSTDESDDGPAAVNGPQPAIKHWWVRGIYICPFENCTKQFNYAATLREHYRTHSHVKPYRCTYSPGNCSYEACTFRFVRRHIRKHHFNGKGDNRQIDKFVETVQRRLAEEEQFLSARLNLSSTSRQTSERVQAAGGEDQNRGRQSDAEKVFACRFCDKRFLGRSAAIRHVQLVHFHIPRIELIGRSKEEDEAQRFVVEWHPDLKLNEREGGSSTPDLSGIDTDSEEEMQTEEVAQNVTDPGEGDLMAGESPEVNEQIPEQPEGGQVDLEREQGAQQEENYDSDVVLISSPETSSRSSPELILLYSE